MKYELVVSAFSIVAVGGISWFFFGGKKKNDENTQSSGETEIVEFNISGMHCAGCAAGIEATIRMMDGIKTASVNFGTSKGIFSYDPSRIKKEDIVAKIRELGYDVSLDIEEFEKKS